MATINNISDVVLCEILSYIDFVSRQRLEIVCKRWQRLIRLLSSKIHKLSFEMEYEDAIFHLGVRKNVANGLEIVTGKLSDVGAILKICENNLTELTIINEGPEDEGTDELMPLRKCKNLKIFSVSTAVDNNLIEDCLDNMPTESLQELTVWNRNDEFTDDVDEMIKQILMQAEQLTSLTLSGASSMALQIIGMKSKLKSLELGFNNSSLESDDFFLNFTELVNLEVLVIRGEMVDDEVLIQIAGYCKNLRQIKLSSRDPIHVGLQELGKLSSLRSVHLDVPKELEVLEYFSNLEEFDCNLTNRDSVNEETLTKFLARSPNFRACNFHNKDLQSLFTEIAAKAGKEISYIC